MKRRLVALMAAAMLAGGACASTTPSGTATPTGGVTPGPAATSAPPAAESVLTLARVFEYNPVFHPLEAGGNGYFLLYLIFDPLVKIDPADPTGTVNPNLASSWDISPDGLTYTFHLRDDVKWHDGEPFNANDVAYTIDWTDQNYPEQFTNAFTPDWTSLVGAADVHNTTNHVSGVKVIDDYTISLTIPNPDSNFLRNLAQSQDVIVPQHVFKDMAIADIAKSSQVTQAPIGTGPYKVTKVSGTDTVEFTAFDDYFAGRAKIDKVVFRNLTAPAALAAIESGELDLVMRVSPTEFERLKGNSNLVVEAVQEAGNTRLVPRLDNPTTPMADVKVRQAMYYAIDRQAIVDSVLGGLATALFNPNSLQKWEDLDKYEFNPDKAKQLLAEAGWDSSRELTWVFDQGAGNIEAISAVIQQNLADVGIKVKLQPMDSTSWSALTLAQDPAIRKGWDLDLEAGGNEGVNPANSANYYVPCDNPSDQNYGPYVNCQVDKLFADAKKELDPAKQDEIYHQLAKILNNDVPILWLWASNYVAAHTPRLHGLAIPPFDRWAFQTIAQWTLDPK